MQALATPELIATQRIESLGVRCAVELDRGSADEILRVDADADGRPIGHDKRQVELRSCYV